jgi:uncharacterized membrane-anchored protein YitT (DUF2179 family)
MLSNRKKVITGEIKTMLFLTAASIVIGFNISSLVRAGGLFPGGFSGLTILIQDIASKFFDIEIAYSTIYLPLNLIPVYIGFKYVGKKFTIYSFYVVFLSSILADLLPSVHITDDVLLVAVFGGILGGAGVSLCLISGASAGGTDFISIYMSKKKV